MPPKVMVYTTQYCPHCMRAKSLLKQKNVAFDEVRLDENDAKRIELEEKTGWQTVPMIFIGDEFIGGANELYELESKGELDPKLK